MSDCKSYVSEEDIKALKESELHIEHVARSRNLAGEKVLSVTDTIRGEKVTNRTLDGLEDLYQNALSNIGYQQMGDYKPGITIDGRNQIVFENGSWYIYRGDLPHVTTGATLTEDGGIWSEENPNGQWVNVGDQSLTSVLSSWKGYSYIDNGNLNTYKKVGVIGENGKVYGKFDVLLGDGGFWFKYIGDDFPKVYTSVESDKWVNVGLLNGFDLNSPENFGAVPNSSSHDCLNAINMAIKTGVLNLYPNTTYHVSNEVVIPSKLHGNMNGATIKAIGEWDDKSSVVRFSKFKIGAKDVQVGVIENQVRGVRITGSLNIDCDNKASYGFYARLLCAESTVGDIYSYNALKWGIVMIGCWYFGIGILHANSCAQGISLGYPTEGETSPSGGLAINAVHLPFVGAWSTVKSKGMGYNPISDDFNVNVIGAGVVLGESLSSSIGVLCSEHTQGAGLVTKNAISWSISSAYFEFNSKDFTDDGNPNVALLSSYMNREGHVLNISNLTLGVKDGILVNKSSNEKLNISSIYRYDNHKTFHNDCKSKSVKVSNSNYYVLAGELYQTPTAIIPDSPSTLFTMSRLDLTKWGNIGFFTSDGNPLQISVISSNKPTGLVISVGSDEGDEAVTVTQSQTKYQLKKARTTGKIYEIKVGSISSSQFENVTVTIKSKVGDWYNW